ncbi:MAG: polyphenol oxidase [Rhodospirillaceae bacterium]|nr:polyphenol oxidase [Rhodospirillaceae bacterium]
MIQIDALGNAGIRHAFFTRRGGVSTGIYRSLNCGFGSGDDPSSIHANRARAMAAVDMPIEALSTGHQHHSTETAVIDRVPTAPPRVDALVSTRPGIALGILTADCAPLLFADSRDQVIGAAHAGWRGALGGIAESTVDAMIEQGARPDNIVAVIGPAIGPESYEVGPEFPKPFLVQEPSNAAFFQTGERDGHFMFDLQGYVAARLARLELREVLRLDCDTCADETNFFSYRRSCHRKEQDYGRMLSVIALEG